MSDGLLNDAVVERLLVQHHIGLDHVATGTGGNPLCRKNLLRRVSFATAIAVIPPYGTVKLQNTSASRFLMKTVNILCDNRLQNPLLLPFRKGKMGRIGFCGKTVHFVLVKAKEFIRKIHEIGIKPDIEENLNEEAALKITLEHEEDNQLQKAIEEVKKK